MEFTVLARTRKPDEVRTKRDNRVFWSENLSHVTGISSPPVPLTRDALLDAIASASLDAVIAVDFDGVIIRWSDLAEKTFGWTENEAVGLAIHDTIIPERDRGAHIAGLARYKSGGRTNIFGSRFRRSALRSSGEEIPIELSIMCIESAGGDLLICFVRDLSEEERVRQNLEELQMRLVHVSRNSAMGTMAGTLAHELNQPLAAASNFISAASVLFEREDATSVSEAKAALARGQAAIKRAAATIKSVREMVDKKPLQLKPHKLRPLVHDAIRLLGPTLGVKPSIEVQRDAEWLLTSKVQLEQILINLLRNASDALRQTASPAICVRAIRECENIKITIVDNGPGMSDERLRELFSPFNSSKPDGLGIGLSICRTLVEQNKGRIWAESIPGKTELHFTIPVGERNAAYRV